MLELVSNKAWDNRWLFITAHCLKLIVCKDNELNNLAIRAEQLEDVLKQWGMVTEGSDQNHRNHEQDFLQLLWGFNIRVKPQAINQPRSEVKPKDLKEKEKNVEETEKKENGSGDAPANGTEEENGAEHTDENAEDEDEEEEEEEEDAEGEEEDGEEDEGAEEEEETDGHAVKRPAVEQGQVEKKRQKSENGESTEPKAGA
ncbi:uncharacterized protein [Scyliorhinus torazame]|uniref:uncharacterized protein n=1 Tax=Scyliorhinus torazame TaxID=75743 RepID=UPI003B5C68F1